MTHKRFDRKHLSVLLPLGLAIMVFLLGYVALGLRAPVQAQDPIDGDLDPEKMAMEPRPMADNELPIRVSVNYAYDIIEESYPAGHTVWITVTTSTGAVKATIELTTGAVPWWPTYQTGFSSELGTWVPGQPDILPGDFVHASSSQGHTTSMQVGNISAAIDTATDRVTGTIDADWLLPDDVEVKCKAYYAEDPTIYNQEFDYDALRSTLPDGEDVYTCNYAREAWQLTPGQLMAVSYDPLEPDIRSNRTVNVFPVPGPHLQVRKWVSGLPGVLVGTPNRPGNLVVNIEYRNLGSESATGVEITDVLQGLSYIADTSGFSHTGSGAGPIVWQVGTVPAGARAQFQVFFAITANQGETVSDTVTITSSPAENGGLNSERRHTWSSTVWGNGSWLSVNKNTWTPNPTPGSEFIYTTKVCNTDFRYAVDSSQTTLTDTLPPGVTLIDWWPKDDGWQESSRTGSQLVLTRPSVAANGCTDLYLRVQLAAGAQPGAELCNTAQVQADNNFTTQAAQVNFCHAVGTPLANLVVDKTWAGGTLVAGGRLTYDIEVHNAGNTRLTGPILVTDTVPAQATYIGTTLDPSSPIVFNPNPVVQTADQLVWHIADMQPGTWVRFSVSFALDDAVAAGTAIANTVEVGLPGLDEDMSDNLATRTDTVRASGPNLRVTKLVDWGNRGLRTNRLDYRLVVENVGDTGVYGVVVADNYDDQMSLASPIRHDWWAGIVTTYNADAHAFYANANFLPPGERITIDFATQTTSRPVPPGLMFDNTATVSPSHLDTDPADNTATVSAAAGPDLTVIKTYAGGEMEPGSLVSYLLTYRNGCPAESWWWSLQGEAMLSDILPVGLEFVSAEQWLCGATTWCNAAPASVVGQTVTWNLGHLAAGEVNALRVTARILPTVGDQTSLTNRATIASNNSLVDAEPNIGNNESTTTILVTIPITGAYTLNTTTNGQGTVTVDPVKATYNHGDVVTLTATADPNWNFTGWTGDRTGTANELILTMTGDVAVVANFAPVTYALTVTTVGEGTVTRNPNQTEYMVGEVVTLTATPDSGWLFTGWSGDVTGTAATVAVTITSDTAVTATFVANGIVVTKAVTPTARLPLGSVVTYTITLDNTGTGALTGIELIDVLPAGVTFGGFTTGTAITPMPDVIGDTLTWTGDLAIGGNAGIVFTATLGTDDSLYLKTITNRVEATIAAGGIAAAEASFTTVPYTVIYLPVISRDYTR